MTEKIYLASPYSSSSMGTMQQRYLKNLTACAKLIGQGYIVYSPIVSWHNVAVIYALPRKYWYWEDLNKEFINWCDTFVYLTLDGYKESEGLAAERGHAQFLGKLVVAWTPGTSVPF